MANSRPKSSSTSDFIRGAGTVQDSNLWGPAKWVVQLVQYMIAIMIVTIGEAFKAILTGEAPPKKSQRPNQRPLKRRT